MRRRDVLSWAKEKTVWETAIDMLSGFLFSLGAFGDGESGQRIKKRFESFLKGQRKQVLGPVMSFYRKSVKEGSPMFKDPKFWVSIGPLVLQLVPQVQSLLPADSLAYTFLAAFGLLFGYMVKRMSHETAEVNERAAIRMLQARKLEHENLERALAMESATVTVNLQQGLDAEL